ncbi:MAG TPA: BadF/BadG/BcrA/BcrD ATPase family protein [Candidatus Koribacter sp.]|jgi:N-acetylglucosamine kinase-like BadF-type ATPase
MSFYLGIDGGGTKTKFLLGDEQKVLAEATAAGSNILRSGEAAVREALSAGVREVCANAAIESSQISRIVAGIAGSSNDNVREALTAILRELAGGEIVVVGDMVIAHYGALEGEPGILVNAGTGSIAYGRNAAGETARAGGWGFAISDEGSGHWIGRVAIATAMRCFDTGIDLGFLNHLMAALKAEEAQDLARFANSTENPDFAQVFPAVVLLAEQGDETAQKILQHAGKELASLSEAVLRKLFPAEDTTLVAASGGVFRNSSTVFESFQHTLREHSPKVEALLTDGEPASGALELARR